MNTIHTQATKQPANGRRRRERAQHERGLTAKEQAALQAIKEWEERHSNGKKN